MTVQSAIIAAIPPGSTLQTLSRRTPFEVADYRDEAMVLLLGPEQSTTPIPWQIWEDLGAWLATRGWTELGGGRGATTSTESLNGFLGTRMSRSVGSYAAAVLKEAGLVETQGVRPVRIRWLATSERTSPARDAANAWAQIQAICREAMATGRTIATIDRAVSNRILDVRPSVIVRVSDEARTPDGQGAPVTRAMVERIWHALVDDGRASRLRGVLFFAYALVAEVPGVAVDDDRRGLRVADWDLAMSSYQGTVDPRATLSGRQYWTLAAHPGRYRVIDAVRDLEEDWWLTGGADVRPGDRVAIWKYKGRDDRRGIIAFGEVLTDPKVRELAGDDATYWVDANEAGSAPQVRVRYVMRLMQPLWIEDTPVDSVLHQLPVSRAQGGTAHHVTPAEWTQLMTLVGGWPRADVDEDSDEAGWLKTEIQPTVASYFTMLRAELAGQPYVKAEVNREVQAVIGRSRGAVEFKFANISAVLKDLGFPYVLGYQPPSCSRQASRISLGNEFAGRCN